MEVKPSFSLEAGDNLSILRRGIGPPIQLVMGSPPYPGKFKRYGQKNISWGDYMLAVTKAAISYTGRKCPIVWVVNGSCTKGEYAPDVEHFMVSVVFEGFALERPLVWHKNSPPSRRDWFVNAWEYILCVKPRRGSVPTFNWEAIAIPPKYTSGGKFRQRTATGERREGGSYPTGKLARPRDVLYVPVGGGLMGSKYAHENEAPYPEALCDKIIPVLTNPGDTVLDPFCGSGTTLASALRLGRNAIGFDIRQSQIDLTRKRLTEGGYIEQC